MSQNAPVALARWRHRIGWSQTVAALRLDVALKTYQEWERGRTWATGAPVPYQRRVMLAAAALEYDFEPLVARRQQPDLLRWRVRMNWSRQEAADAIGMSKKRYVEMERGFDDTLKRPITHIDKRIWLACSALENGVAEITDTDAKPLRARRFATIASAAVESVGLSASHAVAGEVLAAFTRRAATKPADVVGPKALPKPRAAKPAAAPAPRFTLSDLTATYDGGSELEVVSLDELWEMPRG